MGIREFQSGAVKKNKRKQEASTQFQSRVGRVGRPFRVTHPVTLGEKSADKTMEAKVVNDAEAERERRAKVIHAEGELQASEKLAQAAAILAVEPTALQLRYLQTLTEISSEKNSTILFPVPIDLIKMFLEKSGKA